ncbi:dehydrogenase/reductase SDR family member 11-like [Kryptolebias marmoratus]|uniref:dehydrogenase/reductase SDR family member 11-like n=1 Tax=Kryptolebias marmoratus TaxID=37003 RepID=UPI0018ACC4C8|nr:dehydrogenase/reductase SDR family member 11-like [Kryptolebias marmoratus]
MERWRGRVALVTGASVGIGAAIAKELVRFGMKVVGCARSVEKIQDLATECRAAGYSGELVPFRCDLTSVEEIEAMFAAIKAQHRGVDVCVNNAGLAHPEPLLSVGASRESSTSSLPQLLEASTQPQTERNRARTARTPGLQNSRTTRTGAVWVFGPSQKVRGPNRGQTLSQMEEEEEESL